MNGKLGKLAPRVLPVRHMMASRRVMASMPLAPDTRDWTAKMTFPAGPMGNDKLGDCTAAGWGHWLQAITANASTEVTPSDTDIIGLYSGSTGYNPADPSTDQGGVEADVLAYLKTTGCAGYKLDGFAQAQAQNVPELRQVVNTFGGAYIGLALPKTIENQTDVWDVDITAGGDAERGSLGGHCVVLEGYDQQGFWFITWGEKKYLTNAFLQAYNDEAWALSETGIWVVNGKSPAGDTVPELDADLLAVV